MSARKLFNSLVTTGNKPREQSAPGRSSELIAERDRCMVARYYYYGHHRKMKYEETINKLAEVFFLSPERVIRVMGQYTEMVKEMRRKRVSLSMLQEQWPDYTW